MADENPCPHCDNFRQALIESLEATLAGLRDPVLGLEIVQRAGAELAAVIAELVEVVVSAEVEYTNDRDGEAVEVVQETADDNFFDNNDTIPG